MATLLRRCVSSSSSFSSRVLPRLPVTHSSYVPGLLDVLRRVQQRLAARSKSLDTGECVRTIIPGRINRTRGHKPGFSLQLTTTPTESSREYFKALARSGTSVQEVFFVGGSREHIQAAIMAELPSQPAAPVSKGRADEGTRRPGNAPADDRTVALIHRLRKSGDILG